MVRFPLRNPSDWQSQLSGFIEDLLAGDKNAVIIASASYFAVCGVWSVVFGWRLSRWPSVVGRIHRLEVAPIGGRPFSPSDQEYTGDVVYDYVVDGVAYRGDRLSPYYLRATHNLRFVIAWQLKWVERIGENGVRVRHHPTKPGKSYLIATGPRSIALSAFLCFGAAALILSALD